MERQKIPPRESYQQTPRKRAFKTKESPLHTTPKEIKQVSNCSCLTARTGARTRVREGEVDETDKTGRSRNARCSDLPLRGRQNEEVDIEFLRCSRALCEPLVGAGLLRNSGRCSSFWLNLHRSLLRLPPSRRPCRFFAAFVLRPNALAAGQGCAMGSSRPTPGGDVLESKRFGGTTERAKRRLRQAELVLNGEARSRTGHVKIDPTRTRNGDAFRSVVDLPKRAAQEGARCPGRASCLAVVKAPVLSARRLVSCGKGEVDEARL